MQPGTRAHVRFILREPLLLLPGDRFIVRMFSPVVTIGGGMVLDIAAPAQDAPGRPRSASGEAGDSEPADRVALLVKESKYGVSVADLVARTGLLASEIHAIAQSGDFLYLPDPHHWLVSRAWVDQKISKLREILKDFHRRNPLQPGLAKEELRSRELAGAPAFLLDAMLTQVKDITAEGEIVRLTSHRVALKQDEEEAVGKIEELFRQGGLAVPATPEVLAKSGVEAARARSLLQILLRNRKLVRISDDLIYHVSAIETLRQMLAAKKGRPFRRARVQGLDRRLPQVRHPSARIPGPRTNHAPRRRFAGSHLSLTEGGQEQNSP